MPDDSEFLRRWAAARAGDDPKLGEALRELVSAYLALNEVGDTKAIREFLNALRLPDDDAARRNYLLDTKLRAASRLPGGKIYKQLRALETETGLKFAALDRRRRLLQSQDEDGQQAKESGERW